MSKKKVLVTGFSQFEGCDINPTESIVNSLKAEKFNIDGFDLSYEIVEVSIGGAELVNRLDYNVFIHIGVNTKGNKLQLEQYSYNNCTFRVPDQSGNQPSGECINKELDFDKACESGLDVSLILSELKNQVTNPEDVEISNDPGRFLCNYIYFKALQCSSKSIFVHIPPFEVCNETIQIDNIKKLIAILLEQC